MTSLKLQFLLYLLLFPIVLSAEEPVPVAQVSSKFVFDGIITPGEWDHVTPFELTVQTPVHRAEPTEKTVIRMTYDDTYI